MFINEEVLSHLRASQKEGFAQWRGIDVADTGLLGTGSLDRKQSPSKHDKVRAKVLIHVVAVV